MSLSVRLNFFQGKKQACFFFRPLLVHEKKKTQKFSDLSQLVGHKLFRKRKKKPVPLALPPKFSRVAYCSKPYCRHLRKATWKTKKIGVRPNSLGQRRFAPAFLPSYQVPLVQGLSGLDNMTLNQTCTYFWRSELSGALWAYLGVR